MLTCHYLDCCPSCTPYLLDSIRDVYGPSHSHMRFWMLKQSLRQLVNRGVDVEVETNLPEIRDSTYDRLVTLLVLLVQNA